MSSLNCLSCGRKEGHPICSSCIDFLLKSSPFAFYPYLLPGKGIFDFLREKNTALISSNKMFFEGTDGVDKEIDSLNERRLESMAKSIFKHLFLTDEFVSEGRPHILQGDLKILHSILTKFEKSPTKGEVASRLAMLYEVLAKDSLARAHRDEYLIKAKELKLPSADLPTGEPSLAPSLSIESKSSAEKEEGKQEAFVSELERRKKELEELFGNRMEELDRKEKEISAKMETLLAKEEEIAKKLRPAEAKGEEKEFVDLLTSLETFEGGEVKPMTGSEVSLDLQREAIEHLEEEKDVSGDLTAEKREGIGYAQSLLEEGKYEDALAYYDSLLRVQPQNEEAWFDKAEILSLLERYEEAVECYTRVLEIDKGNKNAWAEKANLLFRIGKFQEAISSYRSLLKLDPSHGEELNEKAKGLFERGRYNDAVILYNCVLDFDPKNLRASIGLGDAILALGDMDLADDFYGKALQFHPESAEALYKKGSMLNKKGRWGAAIQLYNKAIAIKWNYLDPWLSKAEILLKQGKAEEAMECYDKVLSFDENRIEAWIGKARASFSIGNKEKALETVKKALEIDPESEEGKALERAIERGFQSLEESNEEYVQGKEISKKEQSFDPSSQGIGMDLTKEEDWLRLGDSLMKKGDTARSLEAYEKATSINPRRTASWCERGEVYEKMHRYEEALRCYEEALKINENSIRARRGREICLKHMEEEEWR